ncbi:MAG: D-2-hydroxyacid dehydrogenase [Clostridia bacterium]|nr:D-2-hydroxyacid dehydrogenase [Clostridia bacterium]
MNLLITGAWQQAREHISEIEAMGHTVVFMQQEKDDLPCDASWVEGVICNGLFLYHPIEDFSSLKWIQLTSAGYDRVPMEYVRERGIAIYNARGVYSIPMAEFAVAGVLSLYKRLNDFRSAQRERRWEKLRDLQELAGQTVLIVGCGSVGTECAKMFRAFDCRIVGVDIAPRADEAYDEMLPLSALDSALPQADVVILTVPLTPDTRGLIDGHRLGLIRGVLVNISRGGVIDQAELEQWPGPAVLDVFEDEPLPPDSPLWQKENTVITPHNSFVGEGNGKRLRELILKNLERMDEHVGF